MARSPSFKHSLPAAFLALGLGQEAVARPEFFDALSGTCKGEALNTLNTRRCQVCHTSSPGSEGSSSATTATAQAFLRSGRSAAAACATLAPVASSNPHPPSLTLNPAGGKRSARIGETVTIRATGRDPDGDAVALSVANLPSDARFDPASGVFQWTPRAPATVALIFTATDQPANGAAARSTSQEVTVAVAQNQAPVLDSLASPVTVRVGVLFRMPLSAVDPDPGNKVKFSFGRDPSGASTKPAGAKLLARPKTRNPGKFNALFQWKPKPSQVESTYLVRFLATDNGKQRRQAEQVVEFRVVP